MYYLLRKKIYQLIEPSDEDDPSASSWIDYFLIALIILNVLAVVFETVGNFRESYREGLYYFEVFSVIIFTIEYFARMWVSVEKPDPKYAPKMTSCAQKRIKYLFSFPAIIDLLAILPFYLSFIFVIDLRFLRILRILRVFKLTRYSESMKLLLDVLHKEAQALTSSFFILIVITTIAASGIYILEHDHQPDIFGSIPQTMWWAIVTLTTVGYGDAYPVTGGGKFFAAAIMVVSIGLVALPTAILASSFSSTLHEARQELYNKLIEALEDNHIDEEEEKVIEKFRKKLGLTYEELHDIKQKAIKHKEDEDAEKEEHKKQIIKKYCPNCGEKL